MNQKEIKALQRKLDKKSLQLMGRYEKARKTHSKFLRKGLKTGNFGKQFVAARSKMENSHTTLQNHLYKSGKNRRRLTGRGY